jgi:hypothetical protein
LPNSNKQYPVTIERVRKIRSLNQQGVIPEELEAVEVTTGKPKELEPEFVDVVGQISLKSLERADKKRRDQKRQQQQGPKALGSPQRSMQKPAPQGNGNAINKGPQGQQRPSPQGGGQKPRIENKGGQQPRPKNEQGQQKSRPPQPRPQQQRPTIKKDNNPPKQEG